MNQSKRLTAIRAWLALMLFWVAGASWAGQVAGTIVQLSGPLMAKRADGAVRILSMKSEVESGDTLVTEKNTYAMVKFIDNSEITLKPSTTFKVENFAYDADKPDGDNASFNLVKGGLRSVTGLLGKRNKEKFSLKTPSATIGIRGTTFVAEWVEPTEQAVAYAAAQRQAWLMASTAGLEDTYPLQPLLLAQAAIPAPGTSALPPGLYVQVIDGMINLTNKGGAQNFTAGQFGYTASPTQPPVIVPKNPGLQFTLPPAFAQPAAPAGGSTTPPKSNTVDCEVR
ncbi:iron dicitrate transport regulator FecR [Duganella sp. FT109W]|uniref:Iron dicitrate transport regulator FecR n=1 Tax=Duganella margarita TaxID=2692170 RepID=A0ABW9WEM6_9BURK|nr:FecR family protein [Duganella margarita]MYN38869.1 iron dicitrate transport regulator FecR [Duganella margarita]